MNFKAIKCSDLNHCNCVYGIICFGRLKFSQVLRVKIGDIFKEQQRLTPRDLGCDENKRTKAVKG